MEEGVIVGERDGKSGRNWRGIQHDPTRRL